MEQDDIGALKLAGLSVNQAKVYLALLSTGRSTIKAISKISEIDRANTSRTVASLEKLALIKKTLAVPNIYEPISIKDAIDVLLKGKSEEYSQIQSKTKALLERSLKIKPPRKIVAEDEFTVVPGKTAFVKYALSLLCSAEHTIDIVSSARRIRAAYSTFAPELKQALERDVTIRLIQDLNLGNVDQVPPRRFARSKLFSKPQWEERYSTNSVLIGAIFDKRISIVLTDHLAPFPNSPCLVTSNKCFTQIVQFYFDGLWSSANMVNTKNESTVIVENARAATVCE